MLTWIIFSNLLDFSVPSFLVVLFFSFFLVNRIDGFLCSSFPDSQFPSSWSLMCTCLLDFLLPVFPASLNTLVSLFSSYTVHKSSRVASFFIACLLLPCLLVPVPSDSNV